MSDRYTCYVDLHLILRHGDQILLGRRINTGFADGHYALPAGHLEEGEPATAGVVREAAEELNVSIDRSDLTCVHVMHHRTDAGRAALFFEVNAWRGAIANAEPDKCAGWDWHDLDALPEPLVPYVAEALDHITTGLLFSELGWNVRQAE